MAQQVITISENALLRKYDKYLKAEKGIQAALARDIYVLYQNAQAKKFQSVSNAGGVTSEGDYWPSLTEDYRRQKMKRFSRFTGTGKRMLIATGTLAKAAIGEVRDGTNPITGQSVTQRYLTEPRRLVVTLSGDYAGYVNERRKIMNFGEKFWQNAKERIKLYFKEGMK